MPIPLNAPLFLNGSDDGAGAGLSAPELKTRFQTVRANSLRLATPLSPEDWMLQSMEDASPIKWHLAHTTWFFETFILEPYCPGYSIFHDDFCFLFNSYYQQVGSMQRRGDRGLLSRPSAAQVVDYRRHVDRAVIEFLMCDDALVLAKIAPLMMIGFSHEEQHQELMQTDILHGLYQNTLRPQAYTAQVHGMRPSEKAKPPAKQQADTAPGWVSFDGGLVEIGADGTTFAFDNEFPRHKFWLNPFELATHAVTNRDFLAFIADGGYQDPRHWLSDGWATVQSNDWRSPLYWREVDGQWFQYTLFGEVELNLDAPVCHVSYYEAAAYASWVNAFLPTEIEWEVAAADVPVMGHFLEGGLPSPLGVTDTHDDNALNNLFGSVWEWTSSPYAPYPGFKPDPGAIGEYNGKFMSSQMVLRGGSCATAKGHVRASYRNFFPPSARWQYSGIRLAR